MNREAIGRGTKVALREKEVEVIAPPRMGNDSEGLLLGEPPSAIDRRPTHNWNATTRSPPGFRCRPRRLRRGPVRHRRRRREAKSGEDRGACGEDRFAIGEDEEMRRVAKTEAPTVKTGSS